MQRKLDLAKGKSTEASAIIQTGQAVLLTHDSVDVKQPPTPTPSLPRGFKPLLCAELRRISDVTVAYNRWAEQDMLLDTFTRETNALTLPAKDHIKAIDSVVANIDAVLAALEMLEELVASTVKRIRKAYTTRMAMPVDATEDDAAVLQDGTVQYTVSSVHYQKEVMQRYKKVLDQGIKDFAELRKKALHHQLTANRKHEEIKCEYEMGYDQGASTEDLKLLETQIQTAATKQEKAQQHAKQITVEMDTWVAQHEYSDLCARLRSPPHNDTSPDTVDIREQVRLCRRHANYVLF